MIILIYYICDSGFLINDSRFQSTGTRFTHLISIGLRLDDFKMLSGRQEWSSEGNDSPWKAKSHVCVASKWSYSINKSTHGFFHHYCWWLRNPANQLRLVVYPIIHRVSYIPGGARFQPSTVSLTLRCCVVPQKTFHFKSLHLQHNKISDVERFGSKPLSYCHMCQGLNSHCFHIIGDGYRAPL